MVALPVLMLSVTQIEVHRHPHGADAGHPAALRPHNPLSSKAIRLNAPARPKSVYPRPNVTLATMERLAKIKDLEKIRDKHAGTAAERDARAAIERLVASRRR